MVGSDALLALMERSVAELDACMGWRNAGIAVSGRDTPSFKHISTGEDPARFTVRVMVAPILGELGYGEVRGPFPDKPVEICGAAVVVSAMNRPLDEGLLVDTMRARRCDVGIATDGFRWTRASRDALGFGMSRADLRPYYVEILERRRFRTAVGADRAEIYRFARTFPRRRCPHGLSIITKF